MRLKDFDMLANSALEPEIAPIKDLQGEGKAFGDKFFSMLLFVCCYMLKLGSGCILHPVPPANA
jgi:hypothetical protein